MDRIRQLRNPIRDYAWGSRTALAELQGRPSPAPQPEAELWIGAHPGAPSEVRCDGEWIPLGEWIRRDPAAVLGEAVMRRFGAELPFLFKVLAPVQALSIQTHPDAEQARAGFERENTAGLALDDPQRNYRDPNPKPELICALTRFEVLCGFRRVGEILAGLEALELPGLAAPLKLLRGSPDRDGLAAFFSGLLTQPLAQRRRVAEQAAEAARDGRGDSGQCALVSRLAEQHPGDPGVLAPLLLHFVALEPGEALFLPAGELHSYLGGVGVELMANSDNVLRGGLTAKHVDVPELLATLSFRQEAPPLLLPRGEAPLEAAYDTPAREFRLSVLRPGADAYQSPRERSVEILLCSEGEARVHDVAGADTTPLARGEALLVPAAVERYRIEGDAMIYRAGVPA
jgi:mannose-6-phosphate isomerase